MNTRQRARDQRAGQFRAAARADAAALQGSDRRIGELPGVEQVAVGAGAVARAGAFFAAQFTAEGYAKADGEDDPRAKFRTVSPKFFASLGVPIIAGRDFNANDLTDSEKVVIVSQSLAQRLFPNQDAVNHKLMWTDPVMQFIGVSTGPRRIVGIAADMDDENIIASPQMVIYHPLDQEFGGGRLFVHTKMDPYARCRSRRSSATWRLTSRWNRRRRSMTCGRRAGANRLNALSSAACRWR